METPGQTISEGQNTTVINKKVRPTNGKNFRKTES